MADRDVTPDDSLLKQIFTTNQPETISIFLQNWDKCVFKAEFPKGLEDRHSACVVRLEAENDNLKTFTTIAAIQQIAAIIIPELVPQTLQVGKAKNSQGRMFHFSVIELVEGDLLEDVWQQMSAEEQSSVVAELVEALEKLHSVRLSDKGVKEILGKTLREEGDEVLKSFEQPGAFGGPHTGFLNDGPALLDSIMERRKLKKPFCTMESIVGSQDIRIQSSFKELGSIVINNSDIDKWPGEAVLCHNDPNPRNLILQSRASSGGKSKYKLAGIIDWELAGFYPASYELSLQDTYLSGANRHVSFYLLLKEHMKNFVPRSLSQIVLLQAMELIFESQQRLLLDGTNIPAHIRKRFMENSKLARDNDPYVGWTRSPQDGPFPEYSSAAIQKLEDDVIEEMVARRNLKANRNSTAKALDCITRYISRYFGI
ncbi:hypothetical protein ACEPPN_000347 [Leptodophora sp. 'Broadleaf-Isolate-01']